MIWSDVLELGIDSPISSRSWPISPLIPSLERQLKLGNMQQALKTRYLVPFTEISSLDYSTVCLTEAFANLWLLGFPLTATIYVGLLSWAKRRLESLTSFPMTAVATPPFYHSFTFEQDFSNLVVGWIRGLPVVLCVACLGVWCRVPACQASMPIRFPPKLVAAPRRFLDQTPLRAE